MTTVLPRPGLASAGTGERRPVLVLFALNGFAFASWAVRVPDISHQVGASHAVLGMALLCVSLGALATMRSTGAVCERLGSGLVSTIAAALLSVSLALPGLVSSPAALCLALTVVGAAGGMLNVAMNSLGVTLERRTGTPLLSWAHAALSFGGLAGGLLGGLAAAHVDVAGHLTAVGMTGLLVTGVLARRLLVTDEPTTWGRRTRAPAEQPRPASTTRAILVLGAVAGCAAYGEGALSDWTTLHLSEDLGAPTATAAAGYATFCLAMGSGRLAGHWLLRRLGATRLTVAGSLVAAIGMLLLALGPAMTTAFLGLVLVGLGFSNIFPVAIARAGALAGPRGVGLASTLGYGGLLLGPATIGFLASLAGLPLALTTVSGLAVVACALAVWVRNDAPATMRWLPSQTETWVRLTAGMVPTATGLLHAAAGRHATALAALDTRGWASDGAWPPLRDERDFRDLELLLGARPRATETSAPLAARTPFDQVLELRP